MSITGRQKEIQILDQLHNSNQAEFLALYGRRRVGKTYLIRHHFKSKGLYIEITGTKRASMKSQLGKFHYECSHLFPEWKQMQTPKDWEEALYRLTDELKKIPPTQKIILFFDELPWLASPRSQLLQEIDYFWNRHWSDINHLLLIVCGSAASWILKKIIYNKEGLYGRLSRHMRLMPFSLALTEELFRSRNITLTHKDIAELYMVLGGVPKYLNYVQPGQSPAQTIQELCFSPQGPLLIEFDRLYESLFDTATIHMTLVRAMAEKRYGLSRAELATTIGQGGSQLTTALQELEESGFIVALPDFGKKVKHKVYRLIDEYSLFYLRWIEQVKSQVLRGSESNYWISRQNSQAWKIWAGYAFENLCLKHTSQMKRALGISAVNSEESHWQLIEKGKKRAEIDLLIDRSDHCINVCEMKFYNSEFTVTEAYGRELDRKKALFQEKTRTRKSLFTTLITPYGIVKNAYALSSVQQSLVLDQLFTD